MNVLISGSAGFVGSHLCERLLKDNNCVIGLDDLSSGTLSNIKHLLDNRNFRFVKGDVCDKAFIKEHIKDCDCIFHLAAQIHVDKSYIEPELTWRVNVLGTQNILELARFYNKRVIFASSSEVYGSAQYAPMDTNHPLDAPHPYGASKTAADRLCYSYWKTYGMDITICRFFNIFGPRQRDVGYGGVISIFLRRVLQGLPLIIYGDGHQTRDYLYIDDAIDGYMKVFDMDPKFFIDVGPFNFGTCREISIKEIAQMITDNIHYDKARPAEVERLICDYSYACDKLGWEPKITFEEGLKKFREWFSIYGFQDKV